MKILLVDDEARLLDSLRRTLRMERPQWEVMAIGSGQEAVQRLAENRFHVLVTDMQMPGMDGAAVLQEARRISPGTVRLILSGHAGQELVQSCEGSFHQFISKPVNPDAFIAVLDSFSQEGDSPETIRARELVAGVERIPTLPRLHQELDRQLHENRPSLVEITHVIRQDLGLASKVLKLVNSSYLTGNRKVTNLHRAVEMLNLDLLRSAVREQGAAKMARSLQPSGLTMEHLWAHCIAVGSAAQRLARSKGMDGAVAEECYTAGLLHDVGMAILAGEPEYRYQEILSQYQALAIPLVELERSRYGTDHTEIGAELLHLWGLDPGLCQAIRHHHTGAASEEAFSVALAVHVADVWHSRHSPGSPFADGCPEPLPSSGPQPDRLGDWIFSPSRWLAVGGTTRAVPGRAQHPGEG